MFEIGAFLSRRTARSVRFSHALPGLLALLLIGCAAPDDATARWKAHDLTRPHPEVVPPAPQILPAAAPADAKVLFDGSNMDQWRDEEGGPALWDIKDGALLPAPGAYSLVTKEGFGDVQLHLEWASPLPPKGEGQGRGNSGVFLMEMYEVQILDSYQSDTYADGQAGSLYGQFPPLVNACLPPGEWQSYDIAFRAPRFDAEGNLLEPARMTVFQNGVLIQGNQELWGETSWLQFHPYAAHPDKLPISLQHHGSPVRFRNIWVRELAELPAPPEEEEVAPFGISRNKLKRYVGEYRLARSDKFYSIKREGSKLYLHMPKKPIGLPLIPRSTETFDLKNTAGHLTFVLDENGVATEFTLHLGSAAVRATR